MNTSDKLHGWARKSLYGGPDSTCWIWQGELTERGYGKVTHKKGGKKRGRRIHRWVWELFYGPIPEGMHVLHHCDVRPCWRPNHLFLGTDLDNMKDAAAKGRIPRGEARPFAKLTAEIVADIKRCLALGDSQAMLARHVNVSPGTIGKIAHGKKWAHVRAP